MEFSVSMAPHPPPHIRYAIVALLAFTLASLPILRGRRIWFSSAPELLALVPLLGGCILTSVGIRDALRGMTLSGSRHNGALAAGFYEAHGLQAAGSVLSLGILIIAALILGRRSRPSTAELAPPLAGRRVFMWLLAASAALIAATQLLPRIAFWTEPLPFLFWFNLFGATATLGGVLLVATGVAVIHLVRYAGGDAVNARWSDHARLLFAVLVLVLATGIASWLAGRWFWDLAMYGF